MNVRNFPESQENPGIVRSTQGATYLPERITEVYVYCITVRLEDFFSAHFGCILQRVERCMALCKASFDPRYDHSTTAHVAQIKVEGTEPGTNFDYKDLEMTEQWSRLENSGNHDALGIAHFNMILSDNVYVVSCSNNDNIMDELERVNPYKRFHWISCE